MESLCIKTKTCRSKSTCFLTTTNLSLESMLLQWTQATSLCMTSRPIKKSSASRRLMSTKPGLCSVTPISKVSKVLTVDIVYTGADDTKFKGWDLRVSGVPTFTSKEHEYGVTCIRDWLGDSHYLVTGKSYSDVQARTIRNSDFGTKEHSKHQQRLWISGCKFGISSITKILKTNSRM
ncbi:unnamed protein product [Moneuplotes crassus]|uniref:Uncharacterized protein n=1 Tax=Euplotes crassus TaxID=5936 RepID=A0AAD1UMM3_EUPCR|nr:unnamed protein product [Moneuplotes crassus]